MEAPYVKNKIPLSEPQKKSLSVDNTITKNEVIVENDNYISSNKCEYDGYTSNEEAFYQSSCDDLINNEENFELLKNEDNLPKSTIDNKNSIGPKVEKAESNINEGITEPIEIKKEEEEREENNQVKKDEEYQLQLQSQNQSVLNVKNSMTIMSDDHSTPLLNKKKSSSSGSGKKLSKFPKHKQSYVKIYLKLKDKLNTKAKKSLSKSKSNKSMNHPQESPIYNDSPSSTNFTHQNNGNENENLIVDDAHVNIDDNHQLFSNQNDISQLNETDIREITVVNADGEAILLPTRKRTDSLPRPFGAKVKRSFSEKTDSTITPKKLKNEEITTNIIDQSQNPNNLTSSEGESRPQLESEPEPKEDNYVSIIVPNDIDKSVYNINADVIVVERSQVDPEDIPIREEEKEKEKEVEVEVEEEKKENNVDSSSPMDIDEKELKIVDGPIKEKINENIVDNVKEVNINHEKSITDNKENNNEVITNFEEVSIIVPNDIDRNIYNINAEVIVVERSQVDPEDIPIREEEKEKEKEVEVEEEEKENNADSSSPMDIDEKELKIVDDPIKEKINENIVDNVKEVNINHEENIIENEGNNNEVITNFEEVIIKDEKDANNGSIKTNENLKVVVIAPPSPSPSSSPSPSPSPSPSLSSPTPTPNPPTPTPNPPTPISNPPTPTSNPLTPTSASISTPQSISTPSANSIHITVTTAPTPTETNTAIEENNTINQSKDHHQTIVTSPVVENHEVKNDNMTTSSIEASKKDNTSYIDFSEKKELHDPHVVFVSKESVPIQEDEVIGAGISMVKPFHPDHDLSNTFIDDTSKNENEHKHSTLSNEELIENSMNEKNLPPLPDTSNDNIEKRKLSFKRKPIKTSLKKSVYAIRYFRKSKEEEETPHYVVVEDFEKFKENTQKSIENSRNFEANTTTINENNEKFKENMKESFEVIKGDLLNINNDYSMENKKLREELVELQYRLISVKEEKEKEIDQLRNEVTEEIIKLQDTINVIRNEKEKEIEQLHKEINELHQKEDSYREVMEQQLLKSQTSLVALKEENDRLKDELLSEIQKMKENKMMEIDPNEFVKQQELQTISKQLVKSNVQWNELSHEVQNLPAKWKKEMEDQLEVLEKNQNDKNQHFENFISDSITTQNEFNQSLKEFLTLQKASEENMEIKTRDIQEVITSHHQQLQEYKEMSENQLWAQNEKLNDIGSRVNRYCSNDYLDTVIELEDLRKITNRTTEELFNLQKLNLYCKNLDRLPKRIFSLENLNELWLGRNNLNNINDKIGNLKNLKRLSIADNNLSQLPAGIKNLKNLTHLYLYKNKLKELPPVIGDLENLIHLDVESNKLTKLPIELKKLSKLENLDIENNLFNEFPAIIFELKNLVKLNLSSNKFFFIPRELENLTHLKFLNLKSNYLRSFPYSVLKFTNLEDLDLSNNLFKDIPSEIRYLDKLKSLNLSNVKIEEITPEIAHLKELKILNLNNCNIRILPNCLKNLQNLEEINLYNNDGINILPEYFRTFKNLKKVVLNKNIVYRNGMEYPRYQGAVFNDLLKKNIIKFE